VDANLRTQWDKNFAEYSPSNIPTWRSELDQMQHRELPSGWDKNLPTFPADAKGIGDARKRRQGAERAGAEYSVDDRRLGRSGGSRTK
jgi:transketolase